MDLSHLPLEIENMIQCYVDQLEHRARWQKVNDQFKSRWLIRYAHNCVGAYTEYFDLHSEPTQWDSDCEPIEGLDEDDYIYPDDYWISTVLECNWHHFNSCKGRRQLFK